LAEWFSDST